MLRIRLKNVMKKRIIIKTFLIIIKSLNTEIREKNIVK